MASTRNGQGGAQTPPSGQAGSQRPHTDGQWIEYRIQLDTARYFLKIYSDKET